MGFIVEQKYDSFGTANAADHIAGERLDKGFNIR
jgi:hypothetical protein